MNNRGRVIHTLPQAFCLCLLNSISTCTSYPSYIAAFMFIFCIKVTYTTTHGNMKLQVRGWISPLWTQKGTNAQMATLPEESSQSRRGIFPWPLQMVKLNLLGKALLILIWELHITGYLFSLTKSRLEDCTRH